MESYYFCNAFTNKGNFINTIYKYVTYNERYIFDTSINEFILVEKEGLYYITGQLKQDVIDLIFKYPKLKNILLTYHKFKLNSETFEIYENNNYIGINGKFKNKENFSMSVVKLDTLSQK